MVTDSGAARASAVTAASAPALDMDAWAATRAASWALVMQVLLWSLVAEAYHASDRGRRWQSLEDRRLRRKGWKRVVTPRAPSSRVGTRWCGSGGGGSVSAEGTGPLSRVCTRARRCRRTRFGSCLIGSQSAGGIQCPRPTAHAFARAADRRRRRRRVSDANVVSGLARGRTRIQDGMLHRASAANSRRRLAGEGRLNGLTLTRTSHRNRGF